MRRFKYNATLANVIRQLSKWLFIILTAIILLGQSGATAMALSNQNLFPNLLQEEKEERSDESVPLIGELQLSISRPQRPIELGDQFDIDILIENASNALQTKLQLQLPSMPGLMYVAGEGIPEEPIGSALVNLADLEPGTTHQLTYTLKSVGFKPGAARFEPTLLSLSQDAVREKINIPFKPTMPERKGMERDGNSALFHTGRIKADFPSGWSTQDADIDFELTRLTPQIQSGQSGILFEFDIEAFANRSEITEFDKPITITVDIRDMVVDWDEKDESSFYILTREDETEEWQEIPIQFDPDEGMLTFQTNHFSSYQGGEGPSAWDFTYTPPGISAYSGASNYSYNIDLPPGIGGLTPSLTLSYNSRGVDGMKYPAMTNGFGAGWGAPQPEIVNGSASRLYHGTGDFDTNRFTLSLNGVSYRLKPVHPTWRHDVYTAIGDPSLKVEYIADGSANNPNLTGEYWVVKTGDGTTYRFGFYPDAEQVVANGNTVEHPHINTNQPRNPNFIAASWKLDTITDKFGRQVRYFYTTQCQEYLDDIHEDPCRYFDLNGGGEHISEIDVAVEDIKYNFVNGSANTIVEFDHFPINWGPVRESTYMTTGHYRPSNILIKQDGQLVSKYTFSYDTSHHNVYPSFAHSTYHWYLTAITQTDRYDNLTMPTQTFSYELNAHSGSCYWDGAPTPVWNCARFLTKVENGYGAVTKFTYNRVDFSVFSAPFDPDDEQYTSGRSYYADSVATWDGVERVYGEDAYSKNYAEYDYAGADACFDEDGSNCRTPHTEPSDTLVGFDQVKITSFEISITNTNPITTPISQQKLTFHIDNYWLSGKPKSIEQIDPDTGTVYSKETQNWILAGVLGLEDRMIRKDNYLYENGKTIHTYETYDYYDDPAPTQFGGINKARQYAPDGSLRSCIEYAYEHDASAVWLINVIKRETSYEGECVSGTKVAETLYRYGSLSNGSSTSPTDTSLYGQGNLVWKLVWDGSDYVTEKYEYWDTANNLWDGLPHKTISYSDVSTTSTYPYVLRNWTEISNYSDLGLPTSVSQVGVGVTTETTTITYDAAFDWLPASITTPQGIQQDYEFDTFGRLTSVERITNGLTELTSYTYAAPYDPDGAGPIEKIFYIDETSVPNDSALTQTNRTYLNGLGQPIQQRTFDVDIYSSSDNVVWSHTAYDALGRAVCQTAPQSAANAAFTAVDCQSEIHSATEYDKVGRVVSEIPISGAANATSYDYDIETTITANGTNHLNLLKISYPNGNAIENYTDAYGQLSLVREMEVGETDYADTRYSYDILGNLEKVVTSSPSSGEPSGPSILRTTTINYDVLGRKILMDDPDMGVWVYAYDTQGNLIRQTDAMGQVICFAYDNFNRLVRKAVDPSSGDPCPAPLVAHGVNHLASFVYSTTAGGSLGQLESVFWGTTPTADNDSFVYDSLGRLTSHTRRISDNDFTKQILQYDVLDRPEQIQYPNGEIVTMSYDREGGNSLQVGSQAVVDNVEYNELGQMMRLTRPHGQNTYHSYYEATGTAGDNNYRLKKIQHGADNDGLADYIFNYDAVGNISTLVTYNNKLDTQNFTYDGLNRLTAATIVGPPADYAYSYDKRGNIASQTVGNGTWTYHYDDPDHIHAVTDIVRNGLDFSYGYDANGNMISRTDDTGSYAQTFDVENRLVAVERIGGGTTYFEYDADGMRTLTIRPDGIKIYTPFPDYEEEVAAAPNQDPVLTHPGNQTNDEGETISLQIVASDPDGDTLSYSASGLPANLTINSSTGLISGVLAAGSAGSYNVQLTVTDGNGGSDGTIFYWTVNSSGGGNQAPTITHPGNQTNTEGDTVSLQIVASDPDGDTLSYSASGLPANLTINSATGLISGALAAGSAGSYNVTVTVSDGNGGTDNVAFTWTVNAPGGGGGDILYIVPNVNNLNAADQAIYNQLIGLGYTISLVRDRDAAVSDANGKALILISYSASRNLVGTMYKNSAVPAMIWDGAILSDMGMVTSTGSVSGQSQIHIIDASHPMADGHSNGNVTIAAAGTKVRWGFPTASADSIAEVAGQPTKSAIFAYETGDSMNGLNAPHRRVGFFIDSTTPVDLNANGWGLFDAAVDWAINGGSSTYMPNPRQATAAAGGAFKGNRMGKRGASAKIQAISGSIQRISLSFAGGPVAVQVSGDPDPANNGLFHIYADHLGSSGSLSDSSGVYIPDSHAKYTPFGDWRTEPTATAGDRYYTNHKHNNLGNGADDLGLIYMNARYYLPGVGRFASADSIVPDPANPQNYNRYSYVNNNPMGYVDSSGHAAEQTNEADSCDVLVCGLNPYEQTGDPYGDFTYEQTILLQLLWLDIRGISDEPLRLGLTFDLSFLARAEYAEYGAAATLYATSPSTFKGSVLENLIDPDLLVGVAFGVGALIGGPGGGNDDIQVAVELENRTPCQNSFSAGALISTDDGFVPIEDIEIGDYVLGYNEARDEISFYPVTALISHVDPVIVQMVIAGEMIETTPEHPFYTADGEWVEAIDLQVGDEIRQADWKLGEVESIFFTTQPQRMYNFSVSIAHTYFIGDGQWLVHNSSGDCDRTPHGLDRSQEEDRRTQQAFNDRDNPLEVYRDNETGNTVYVGKNKRTHIFTPEGMHHTTFNTTRANRISRVLRGKWTRIYN